MSSPWSVSDPTSSSATVRPSRTLDTSPTSRFHSSWLLRRRWLAEANGNLASAHQVVAKSQIWINALDVNTFGKVLHKISKQKELGITGIRYRKSPDCKNGTCCLSSWKPRRVRTEGFACFKMWQSLDHLEKKDADYTSCRQTLMLSCYCLCPNEMFHDVQLYVPLSIVLLKTSALISNLSQMFPVTVGCVWIWSTHLVTCWLYPAIYTVTFFFFPGWKSKQDN